MHELREEDEEVWLSGDELCRQFQMFTPFWLKRYGHLLPRTKVVVVDGDDEHGKRWAYPRNKIQRMAREGKLMELQNKKTKAEEEPRSTARALRP